MENTIIGTRISIHYNYLNLATRSIQTDVTVVGFCKESKFDVLCRLLPTYRICKYGQCNIVPINEYPSDFHGVVIEDSLDWEADHFLSLDQILTTSALREMIWNKFSLRSFKRTIMNWKSMTDGHDPEISYLEDYIKCYNKILSDTDTVIHYFTDAAAKAFYLPPAMLAPSPLQEEEKEIDMPLTKDDFFPWCTERK